MIPPWLDLWLREALRPDSASSREELRALQMRRVRATLEHAAANSPFYRSALQGIRPETIRDIPDMARLPRTAPESLREKPESFLALSQDEVSRVVSVPSSGTSGPGKRVFYSAGDQARIMRFFGFGMRNLLEPGETALVLLPGERPGSVGLLLAEALESFGARAVIIQPDAEAWTGGDNAPAFAALRSPAIRCIVGAPAHVHALAVRWRESGGLRDAIRSVLLCWDTVPASLAQGVRRAFGCRVLQHWGMVETGLGGAVSCGRDDGMHLREADILVEIADPETGAPLPDGAWGEILVTTLSRRAMPLIRYRTGDLGRILPESCACGSPLRRLDARVRRMAEGLDLPGGGRLRTDQLGETLFDVPDLVDFHAELQKDGASLEHLLPVGTDLLAVEISTAAPEASDRVHAAKENAEAALRALPAVATACEHGMRIRIRDTGHACPVLPGLAKRTLKSVPSPTEKERP